MYDYKRQKTELFTEQGMVVLLNMRDKISTALKESGAFRVDKVMTSGDTWTMLAALDYMEERGEIKKISPPSWAAQHGVYVAA